ncbi:MAG: glycosyltransferase [Flavobacteriaceae bacterium]|nr:glycosyltransferase [Flavobacteriaceae bacterium]
MAARVLIVTPTMDFRFGGPPRVVNGSAVALARAGCEVEVATMGDTGEAEEIRAAWPEMAEQQVPLHIFARGFPRLIGRSRGLTEFVRSNLDRFDLLHVHCIWETGLADAARIFRKAGKPVVVSPHGMLVRWELRQSRIKKRIARMFFGTGALLNRSDAVLFGTQEEADEASPLRLGGQVLLMPNGATPLHIVDASAARESVRDKFPAIREWERTVLYFSRLHHKKGLDLLVEAFARVYRDFPGAGLFAAAIEQDLEYEARVRSKIAALGDVPILLTTEISGPSARTVFTVADIFSLPSHQEGFSIALLEAASEGLPLLITDMCHMQEVADEGAGVVVPVTVDGLEEGLRKLLSLDDAALAEMGRRAAGVIATRYTWESVAARLIAVYAAVFAGKG